jgi:hypothetical protein
LAQEPLDPLVVFFSLTGGAYAVGTWIGRTLAVFLGRDRTSWGDWGGIGGGLVGFGLFFGYFIGKVFA